MFKHQVSECICSSSCFIQVFQTVCVESRREPDPELMCAADPGLVQIAKQASVVHIKEERGNRSRTFFSLFKIGEPDDLKTHQETFDCSNSVGCFLELWRTFYLHLQSCWKMVLEVKDK